LILGILGVAGGWAAGFPPAMLGGIGLIASTVPAALAFDNNSRAGRWVFGSLAGVVYLATAAIVVVEACRPAGAEGVHPASAVLGSVGLLCVVACTWLGNVLALRHGIDS